MESNNKFRNLPITTFCRYEYEYAWICELIGSWGVQLSLNMWTPEVVLLKSGVTTVVELKFGLPKHALYSYVTVGHIYNSDSRRNRYKNLVLIGKNKTR